MTPMNPTHSSVSSGMLQDSDPAETQEWLESLDRVLQTGGSRRCEDLLRRLQEHARSQGVDLRPSLNTPYCNTIACSNEPAYPGDLDLERQITSIVRWNALATFRRKNKLSDPGRLTLHAADMVFGGDFALVHSRARSEWTLPA
jgi:pyruvate dehydrogenase complex dehydrogenase (E1) component